jgi:hypothetical protein
MELERDLVPRATDRLDEASPARLGDDPVRATGREPVALGDRLGYPTTEHGLDCSTKIVWQLRPCRS